MPETEPIKIHTPDEGWLEVTPVIVCGIWAAHPGHMGGGKFATRGAYCLTHLPSGFKAIQIYRKDWAIALCRFMGEEVPAADDPDEGMPSPERLMAIKAALFRWGETTEGVEVRRSHWGGLEVDHEREPVEFGATP